MVYKFKRLTESKLKKFTTFHSLDLRLMTYSAKAKNWRVHSFIIFYCNVKSRGSRGSIVSDHGLDDWGSILDRGRGFFFQPLRPDRL
jgi:hypothetical protein